MVERPRTEVQDRHQRRPPYRWPGGDDIGVGEKHNDRHQRGEATVNADERQATDGERSQDGDVAAGNRDDVVGARRLQSGAHLVGQARAIANENCGDDRRRHLAVREHPSRDGAANCRTDVGGVLLEDGAVVDDLDQQCALDRAQQRDAGQRCIGLEIGYAVVQISGRPSKRHRHLDGSPRAPFANAAAFSGTIDAQHDSATHRPPAVAKRQRDRLDPQRHELAGISRVLGQPRLQPDRFMPGDHADAIDRCAANPPTRVPLAAASATPHHAPARRAPGQL